LLTSVLVYQFGFEESSEN